MGTARFVEPISLRLARSLREAVMSGRYAPGDRFPSERDLVRRHGISRVTANKVLSALVAEGLLEFRRGMGAFVAARPGITLSLAEMESFTTQALAGGLKPSTRVRVCRRVPMAAVPTAARAALAGAPGIWAIERVRFAGREPVILEERWVRADRVPDLTARDLAGSFYGFMERAGRPTAGVSQTVTARPLDARRAAALRVRAGFPALVVEGPGFDASGGAVWYQVTWYRGDRHAFRNEIRARGAGVPPAVEARKLVVQEVAA